MIKFENACDIAYNYFKRLSTEYVLTSALESDAYWIFYGGVLDKIEYGGKGIKIKKSDGTIETFLLPKELKLLHNSIEVPLADSFKREIMNIKQITNNLQDEIYNDENLSLPFILEHNGKEKLAYFVFSCSDSDDILEITDILKVIVVDYDTTDITYLKDLPNLNYPISISFESQTSADDLDALYGRYYNNIEKYFSKKSSKDEYCEIADKVLSDDFKKLYKNLGAKFI